MSKFSSVLCQKGVALITAMLVLALAVTVAASMSFDHQLDIRRVENMISGNQAWSYQNSAEVWAKVMLTRDDKASSTVDKERLQDLSDQSNAFFDSGLADKDIINIKWSDEQAKFNINNLIVNKTVHQVNKKRIQRLFVLLDIDPNIVNTIIDWIDSDMVPTQPYGAEDLYYNQLSPPYLTAGQYMRDISELRLIKGVSAEVYEKLSQYLTALPHGTEINLNTAPSISLAALVDGMSLAKAEDLSVLRDLNSYQHIQEFISQVVLNNLQFKPEGLSVTSDYFLITGQIKVLSSVRNYNSLLHRKDNKVVVLKRTTG